MSPTVVDPWKMQKGTFTMFLGEVIGTATLIFIGCMGCVGTMGIAPPPPMQTALTFGLTVNLIIMVSPYQSSTLMMGIKLNKLHCFIRLLAT